MGSGGGEGGGSGRERGSRRGILTEKKKENTKTIGIRYFCAHALYKISSSWLKRFSSFNKQKE